MRLTGTLLKGVGHTKEEAHQSLHSEIKKYNEGMQLGIILIPTGEKIKSPGLVEMRTPSGRIVLKQDDRREVPVMARPDLAKYIQGGRKENIVRETRQIRRARTR
jgi:hypothetical protein